MKRIKIEKRHRLKDGEKPQADHKAFYVRHDRFFTLLGSFIIFLTFIVKEGIGENLKNLASSIGSAENMFSLRQETANRLSSVKSLPPPWSQTEPTREERKGFIDLWNRQSDAIVRISLDLAALLPDKADFQKRGATINGTVSRTDMAIDSAKGTPEAPKTKAQIDDSVKAIFKQTNDNFSEANLLGQDILDEANNLKEKREGLYKIAKWASYILFTVGWSLTFYGQLSNDGEHVQKNNRVA
jgi:hypothetical protein